MDGYETIDAKYETGFEQHRRPTRRDEFLNAMNRIVPWADLCAVIDPHYPKRGLDAYSKAAA
jgi:IS5 family transposase